MRVEVNISQVVNINCVSKSQLNLLQSVFLKVFSTKMQGRESGQFWKA